MATIDCEKLAEMMSLPMVSGSGMHIGVDPGAPPDRTEYHLTDMGWATKALEAMLGCGPWVFRPDPKGGGCYATCDSFGRTYLTSEHVVERDPVKLMNAFCCAACGRFGSGTLLLDDVGAKRAVCHRCEACGSAYYKGAIGARDVRLGIHPRAKMWEKGGCGVKLECAKVNIVLGDMLKPMSYDDVLSAARDMGRYSASWIDRQTAEILIGQSVATGQMMAVNDDCTVRPALISLDGGRTVSAPKLFTAPCDWCGAVQPANADTIIRNHCGDSRCRQLERLYRERVSAGGVDCPEERDSVRRFVVGQWEVKPLPRPRDFDGMNRRGLKHEPLDHRIAAARAEQEVKRGAHDWDSWSTATSES